jgi:hypothetical protein
MAPHSEQTRLVFTVFDEIDRLWRAVVSLIDEGIEAGQFCVVALDRCRPVLDSSLRAAAIAGRQAELAHLLKTMKPCPWLGPSREVFATSGAVLAELCGADGAGHVRPVPPAVAKLRESFASLSAPCATGLVVSSRSPRQQSVVTRTLLHHSSYWVTTHEFAVSPERETCTIA